MDSLQQSGDASISGFRGAGISLIVITALFVTVRIGNSFSSGNRRLLVDDFLSVLAFILLVCYSAWNYVSANELQDPNNPNVTIGYYMESSLVLTLLAGFAMYFSKTPLLILYIRLFGIKSWLRVTCYATLTLSFILFLTSVSVAGTACSRSDEAPDPTILTKCIKTSILVGVMNGSTAVVTDIIIIILPLPIIAKLALPLHKKIGLAILFLTGIFAIVASVVSLYFKSMSLAGYSAALGPTLFCTIIECSLAIMVGCAPAVRSCWTKYERDHALYAKMQSMFSSFKLTGPRKIAKSECQQYEQLP
ncbi:hypothetical protein F4820DRAFT_416560 [Hypoxylon rubiginosum]|uniref:Uncharacterized protein n=1 Tax=Hypoxylon rubiginosum TaxID=110542 RepID=A0ACB9Z6H3_9PEZI|nr:hypothetical protein F4820DRAFT_416560 [Hypoxylon rubiginosum]